MQKDSSSETEQCLLSLAPAPASTRGGSGDCPPSAGGEFTRPGGTALATTASAERDRMGILSVVHHHKRTTINHFPCFERQHNNLPRAGLRAATSVGEVLDDDDAGSTGVEHADADPAECGGQDISPVAGAGHQTAVCGVDVLSVRDIPSGDPERNTGPVESLSRAGGRS
ncbi:MAG: hypothetical protein Q8R78_04525 [Candidatus Omnitrophota bacterium]|nr:hypothetical protein [Candidatus Omnitrophota bacterium]